MTFKTFLSKKIALICAIYLFSTAMSTFTRYTKPVPEGVIVCDTYEQLIDASRKYPYTGLWPEDGGYYMKDTNTGEIYAVASDALIPELDRRNAEVDAYLKEHPEDRAPEDPEELKAWVAAGYCTKPDASSTDSDRNTNANDNDKSQ